MLLTQELPFAPIGEFLDEQGVDVKLLRQALLDYVLHCGEELKMVDHYADPEGWLEAVGYREAVEAFLGIV